jgi:hypothetical protein
LTLRRAKAPYFCVYDPRSTDATRLGEAKQRDIVAPASAGPWAAQIRLAPAARYACQNDLRSGGDVVRLTI